MTTSNATGKRKRSSTAVPMRDPRRPDTWHFYAYLGVEGGKKKYRHVRGCKTRKEAQEKLDEIRQALRKQTYVAPTKLTVREYAEQWLAGLPATGLRTSTVDGYRRNLEYVIDRLGDRRLEQLSAFDLDALYSELLAGGRRLKEGEGLSPRSVRYIHTTVHKALRDAHRKGLIARNVAEVASPPTAKSTRPGEMAWWTPAQLRSFFVQTADEPLAPLFRVAAMTGMRRGEVCGLRWSEVDLEKGRIEVRQQLLVVRGQPNGGLVFSERTKTDHGRRRIDLDPGTVATLKAQRARQAELRLAFGAGWRNERDLVFTRPDGSPLDPESVAKVFDRRVARSGLPRIRFHDLRHTHVAHLIAAGEQPLLISKRLGHASAAFTQDRYGHLFEDAGTQAATAVAAMVDGL